MALIVPVLLAGGTGTRLWPMSRQGFPKQFAPLFGSQTLFQTTACRFATPDFADPMVMTASDFRFIVSEQLEQAGITPSDIVIEPDGRNTAAPVLAACLIALRREPEALLLVTPTDQLIPDPQGLSMAVERGIDAAMDGQIVTFGVVPDRAESGYGYLQPEGVGVGPIPVTRFIEKPDGQRAREFFDSGNFLWNSGILLCKAKAMIAAFSSHAPEILSPVQAACDGAKRDLGFLRLAHGPWSGVKAEAVDKAILEKAENLSVVKFDHEWSDMGDWDAVWRKAVADGSVQDGVIADENATAIDCKNVLIRSDNEDLQLVGIGLQDIVAVATPDAVLVSDRKRAQEVRLAINTLKKKGKKQATAFPRDHRPWGWFETLAQADRFQVKRIVVHPGAAMSLQSHLHRSEHWIVVSGTARVTLEESTFLVNENQSIFIPLGARHRLENPGKVPMTLIEVQTGIYLGEDDITRYDDVYSRASEA